MKRIIFAFAAVTTLIATPAFAGLVDEVAQEKDTAMQIVATPRSQRQWLGQYQILGSRLAEGLVPPSDNPDNTVRIVTYPQAEQPLDRGR